MMTRNDYDGNLKAQPDEMILSLIRLQFPGIGDTLMPLPREIHVRYNLRADFFGLTTMFGHETISHVEFQTRYTKYVPLRMFRYSTGKLEEFWQMHRRHPHYLPIVIILNRGGPPLQRTYPIMCGEIVICELTIYYILIYDMKWEDLPPIALSLAPFCKNVTFETLINVVKRIKHEAPSEHVDNIIYGMTENAVSHMKLTETKIHTILGKAGVMMQYLDDVILKSKLVQTTIKEEKAKAAAEALAKGEAKALIDMITILWQQRFETAPNRKVKAAIKAASMQQLRNLLSHILTETEEELQKRLGV